MVHDRAKRAINTEVPDGHLEELSVVVESFQKVYTIDLQKNRELLPDHHFHRHHQNGKVVINRPFIKNQSHCYYKGHVRGIPDSWAALSTCHGLSGVFYDGKELHYVEPPSSNSSGDRSHFIYKHSHLKDSNWTCGYEGTSSEAKSHNFHSLLSNRVRRSETESGIRGPYNSNSKSRYVELVLVNDNRLFKEMKGDVEAVYARSKDIANIANALYAPLDIFIALVGVVVWSEFDEITLSTDGDTTLTNFLYYRRERLVQEHPNDNAQLVTGIAFNGGVVGKALKGPICTYEYSGGVNMDHNPVVGLVATTVAHELGHNFGMEHDDDDCSCPEEKCIMAPASSQTSPTHWSSCSLDYLKQAFEHGMDYCLRNKPTKLIGPVCGNGFVEKGEECDCGLRKFCNNHCCNASSCMLFANATCATGSCCDLRTCQVLPIASKCRPAESECDLPEYCDGLTEYCPIDVHKQDGFTCKNDRAFCFKGQCRTHTDQCKLLWGTSGQMSDQQCFEYNRKGTANGNCGYFRKNQTYKACMPDDTLCGMLHCTHLNERLEFGMESVAILSRSYITEGNKVLTCRSAIVDLGLNSIDPGLAPDGARCGEDKVCVNQRCLSVGSLRSVSCAHSCNGNGVCNSRGNCHCSLGYAPPNCDYPGTGGSEDSGPATDPNASYYLTYAMYIIFLAIVPAMAVSAFVFYYYRGQIKRWWIVKGHEKAISRRTRDACQRRNRPPSKVITASDKGNFRTLEISGPLANRVAAGGDANGVTSPGSAHSDGGTGVNNSCALTRTHSVKAAKLNLDRNSLRNLEISNPIPQVGVVGTRPAPVPLRPAPPLPMSPTQDNRRGLTTENGGSTTTGNSDACPPSWRSSFASRGLPTVSRTSSMQEKASQGGSVRLKRLSSSSFRPTNPPPRPPPLRGKSTEEVSPTDGIYESVIYSDGKKPGNEAQPTSVPSDRHRFPQTAPVQEGGVGHAPGLHMSKYSHTYAQPKTSALAIGRLPSERSVPHNGSSGGIPKMGAAGSGGSASAAATLAEPARTGVNGAASTRANMGASSLVGSLAKRFESHLGNGNSGGSNNGGVDPMTSAQPSRGATAVQGKDSFRNASGNNKMTTTPTPRPYMGTLSPFPRPT